AASSGNWCNSVIIALLEIAYIPTDIRLILGTGGTVTVENRDVFVEVTGTYSRRVTGSPVHKPAAGNGRHPLLEVQSMLFGYFELKAMLAAVPAA
ncbi:hypothetical protein LZ645_09155, partial [Shewanella algae]|uniref:hypothetical protein n=1 Tax=Shewanella algae TaxID=38313 RepID=UPI001F1EAC11